MLRLSLFLLAIHLTIISILMVVLRQAPSEAMWIAYDPLFTESLSFRLSLKPSSIPQPLLNGPMQFPSWSPDGGWIAFVVDASIYRSPVRNRQTARAERIFSPPQPASPNLVNTITSLAWSPDGHQLAFTLNGAIYVINADGSNIRQLAGPDLGSNHHLSWSPDSQTIAFIRLGQVYRVDADGSDFQLVIAVEGLGIQSAAWSPDGEWIAFAANDIYKIHPDGSDIRQLTHTEQYPFHDPVWSPDSKWLAIHSVSGAFRLHSDRADLHQLSDGSGWRPSWSADGRWIAFETWGLGQGNNIMVMRPDGTQRRYLIQPHLLQHHENFAPSGLHFAWSPLIDLPINIALLMAISGILILSSLELSLSGRRIF